MSWSLAPAVPISHVGHQLRGIRMIRHFLLVSGFGQTLSFSDCPRPAATR
jgi:hypothetical protein